MDLLSLPPGSLVAIASAFAAVTGLFGVVIGALIQAGTKRKEQGLTEIQAAVQVLRAEYDRLSTEVRLLRSEMESERKGRRMVQEKYSVSLTFIGSVQAWFSGLATLLKAEGIEHSEFPDPPELIRVDLKHMTTTDFGKDTNNE